MRVCSTQPESIDHSFTLASSPPVPARHEDTGSRLQNGAGRTRDSDAFVCLARDCEGSASVGLEQAEGGRDGADATAGGARTKRTAVAADAADAAAAARCKLRVQFSDLRLQPQRAAPSPAQRRRCRAIAVVCAQAIEIGTTRRLTDKMCSPCCREAARASIA